MRSRRSTRAGRSPRVELVDPAGRPVGSATVARAHTPPGRPHRAFSVLLVAPDRRRSLLQQRAAGKTRFAALRWVDPAELSELLADRPSACAPWLAGVVGSLAAATGPPWDR